MKKMNVEDLQNMSVQEFLMQDATPIERAYIYAFNDEIRQLLPNEWMMHTIQHVRNLEAKTEQEAKNLGIFDAFWVCEELHYQKDLSKKVKALQGNA